MTLDACLSSLDSAEKKLKKGPDPAAEQRKHDIGVYLAEHLAATIEDSKTWERSLPDVKRNNGRERARQALERHRTRTPEEVRRAEATVGDLIDDTDIGLQKLMTPRALAAVGVGLFGGTFIIAAFFDPTASTTAFFVASASDCSAGRYTMATSAPSRA